MVGLVNRSDRVPGIVRHNLCFRRSRDTAECGQGPCRLAPEGFEPAKSSWMKVGGKVEVAFIIISFFFANLVF